MRASQVTKEASPAAATGQRCPKGGSTDLGASNESKVLDIHEGSTGDSQDDAEGDIQGASRSAKVGFSFYLPYQDSISNKHNFFVA